MPFTWTISIKRNSQPPGCTIFEPSQVQAEVGDQVFWRNDDSVPHFPTPVGQSYVFMPNQIAPNSTSPAFAPSQSGVTISYVCSLHPNETGGTLVVK